VTSHLRTQLTAWSAAAALAVTMLAAPVALARPIDAYDAKPAPTTAPPVTVELSDQGFDWGAAGIGAGIALGVIVLTAGGFRIRPGARVGHAG
jgi:hypothetical protein